MKESMCACIFKSISQSANRKKKRSMEDKGRNNFIDEIGK